MAINFNSQGIPLSLKVFLSETGWKEQDKASPLDFVFIVKKAEEDLWFVLFTAFDKKGKGHEIFIPCETESSCVSIVGSHSQVNLKEHLAFLAEVKKKE